MSLHQKVELAFVRLIKDRAPDSGLHLYTGHDDDKNIKPCVIVHASNGSVEEPASSGNRFIDVEVTIKSLIEPCETPTPELPVDAVALHASNVDAVQNALLEVEDGTDPHTALDLLAERLHTQVEDFYVFAPVEDVGTDHTVEARCFCDTLRFRIYCCELDIQPA